MDSEQRRERLRAELQRLQALARVSGIFRFDSVGVPPDRYRFTFAGRGLARAAADPGRVEVVENHEIELRLPAAFPDQPPDIRWLTPLFHPNVSFSGLIRLEHLGLAWQADLGLDLIAERLWDVARAAYLDREGAANVAARQWLDAQDQLRLPVDERPLRNLDVAGGADAASGGRLGAVAASLARRPPGEVLYIGEDTPTPELPRWVAPRRRPREGDDVLYIGDE